MKALCVPERELRLVECLGLRGKDVSLERRQVVIRVVSGFRERMRALPTPRPSSCACI